MIQWSNLRHQRDVFFFFNNQGRILVVQGPRQIQRDWATLPFLAIVEMIKHLNKNNYFWSIFSFI